VVISDGYSIADLPSNLLDEEKLTLLAAPRTSMARNTELLNQLTAECGGAGFWALLDGEQMICLNAVVVDAAADPGFRPGDAKPLGSTRIPGALARRERQFVPEADGRLSTMLVPIRSSRGHELGWIGLTLPAGGKPPAAEGIISRVEALGAAAS
jgi:ribose transport system ATP-binding protein/rhamnose transport system ATP-binding protein